MEISEYLPDTMMWPTTTPRITDFRKTGLTGRTFDIDVAIEENLKLPHFLLQSELGFMLSNEPQIAIVTSLSASLSEEVGNSPQAI
jgi:hypothetical protein